MSHIVQNRSRLLARVRRIRGQVEALERALEAEAECGGILHLIAACRGALNGLMSEVVEGHVRFHVAAPGRRSSHAAQDLIDLIRTYLK
ncbi:MAG: metal/formaldehyde-sensitive transcriptional repressor [Planctomycetes bacterium]|nr:metal/formaldehyde-sensitive transcriptional repressor [Planctomycetota bacterium]